MDVKKINFLKAVIFLTAVIQITLIRFCVYTLYWIEILKFRRDALPLSSGRLN